MEGLRKNVKRIDYLLLFALLGLAVFGCLAILASTYGKSGTNVPANAFAKQVMFEVLGTGAMALTASMDYRSLRKVYKWMYAVSVFLLVVVMFMPSRFGAHAWIPLGPLSFQPSELAKLALIVAIAGYMADVDESEFPDYGWKTALPVIGMFLVPFALTLKEPALGQALVMFAITFFMYMVFAKRSYFLLMFGLFVLVIAGLTAVALAYSEQAVVVIQWMVKHHLLQGFQAQRILTWLDPNYSLTQYGYNVHQAQIAVGSGQVFGEGFLNGIETRGNWIPNQWTDFIFTAVAEEFGFVGSSLLILFFLLLFDRLVRIAAGSQDTFGTYIVVGIVAMFAFQVFENIGMNMYLSPSTGITLPFISYGGSSLIINYVAVGLALSVSLRRKALRFTG
ncbi:rod shape-determining protein RodA [Alicyclobacillus cellulosilyticus]|uniref:Rod shape-determining protein RodA n=1 Tax=Alicyclobacillus cellulosilyticus TaxID=1003997 RepID=A0A917NFN2_9BACL|nr:FtsW/RodA/SpoVE family cell cycle protein [Alicyclobacillus cellulosilyticus]GGI97650.1 rod shape-determining protein RodA [Alicyclobacillus cellulosilyticus]